jgi:hypothetical protein
MRARQAAAQGLHSNQELQRAHCSDTRRSGRGRAWPATAAAPATPRRLHTVSARQLVSTWLQKHPAHVQGSPSAQAQTTRTCRQRRPASAEAAKTSACGPAGAHEQQQAQRGLPCQKLGAENMPPAARGKTTRVRRLQSRPQRERACRRNCEAGTAGTGPSQTALNPIAICNAQAAAPRAFSACTARCGVCTGWPARTAKEASRDRDGGCFEALPALAHHVCYVALALAGSSPAAALGLQVHARVARHLLPVWRRGSQLGWNSSCILFARVRRLLRRVCPPPVTQLPKRVTRRPVEPKTSGVVGTHRRIKVWREECMSNKCPSDVDGGVWRAKRQRGKAARCNRRCWHVPVGDDRTVARR